MALVFKKIAEYEWPVKVKIPNKGKYIESTFTATFKNVGRKSFNDLIEGGDDNFVKTVLLGWSGLNDEDGSVLEFNDENFEAILDNQFYVTGIIAAYGESMQGALAKN
mgnify:FL=1|tara:strand:+ start:348 stop:671 length:324 start_codon:yes stop_codon:yes gene_type:complete